MSSNEPDFEPAPPDDSPVPRFPPARPLAVRPSDPLDPADWPQAPPAGPGPGAILHGLRRRWFAALLVGLVGCGLSAAAAWFYLEPKFVAEGYLKVESKEPAIIAEKPGGGANDFELYKRTQRELILSRFVLNAALRDPTISTLPLLVEQDDPIAWLARQIRVDYPGNAEILRISLKGDHAQDLRDIVNAVIKAYLEDATQVGKGKRATRLAALEKALANAEESVRKKRTDLRGFLVQYGNENVLPKEQADLLREHQNLLDQVQALRLDQIPLEVAAGTAQSMLDKLTAFEEAKSVPPAAADPAAAPADPAAHPPIDPAIVAAIDAAIDAAVEADPHVVQLRQRVTEAEAKLAEANRLASKSKNPDHLKPYELALKRERDDLARQQQTLRALLADRVVQQRRDDYTRQRDDAQNRRAALAAQIAQLDERRQALEPQVRHFGNPPPEMAMLQDELSPLLDIVADLARQVYIERAEQTAVAEAEQPPQRLTLLQLAETPTFKDNTSQIQAASASALLGLLFPMFAIAWFDARGRRVNSVAEVNHLLGMRVLGSLPMLPDPSRRLLGRLEPRTAHWRVALRESIDGVRTMLLRETDLEPTRVVLVTSAVSGEGKTSLATQLAVSFARAHCRTILVDFDLRRPAAHRVFTSPLTPGVCDLLRGQALLADCIQPTRAANLSLLPAGACDDQALAALARPHLGDLFDQLKADFDFVIVDCSPVLPVVDALLVGRHVDAALLSVLRDVSQAPKIQAAHDRLTALAIRVLGTVVTGKEDIVYRPDYRYQPHAS